MDEPTIGLDPSQIVEIRQLIQNLEGAHTVMLSSHILPEVSQLCHRVIIINRGQSWPPTPRKTFPGSWGRGPGC